GTRAAQAAAQAGADVVLVEEGPALGGRAAGERTIEPPPGVEVLTRAGALGYFDGVVPVWQGDTLHQIRARRHVFATGTIEQPLLFAGNDLPGVMLSGGARRLARWYSIKPGERAVVATTCDLGLQAAIDLRAAGVEIAAVADARPAIGALAETLASDGVEVLGGYAIVQARGRGRVRRAVLAPLARGGAELSFDCDLVVIS